MVMTIAKITAGDGYTYLTRHTARGDAPAGGARDAAAYYTAQGNPPGVWTGRGTPLLGLAGREVTEEQMRALFGLGAHPDAGAITAAYLLRGLRDNPDADIRQRGQAGDPVELCPHQHGPARQRSAASAMTKPRPSG
jgi:hypothetical protein